MCLTVQDFMVLESWSLMWAETWSAKGSSIIADRESFAHKDPEGVRETGGGLNFLSDIGLTYRSLSGPSLRSGRPKFRRPQSRAWRALPRHSRLLLSIVS